MMALRYKSMSEIRSSDQIRITLNGENRKVPAGLTVRGLLDHLELDERLVVVERNREILRRGEYVEVRLEPGDTIELVHFVAGG